MNRVPLLCLVGLLGLWSCRGGSAAAKGCGGAGKATRSAPVYVPPTIRTPPVRPPTATSGAARVDDFAAPVDRVGKPAVIGDTPLPSTKATKPPTSAKKSGRSTGAPMRSGDEATGKGDVAGTALDVVPGGDDDDN